MRALRMSHGLTLFHPPLAPAVWPFFWCVLFVFVFVFVCFFVCLFPCFACARGLLTIPPRVVDLDDRQCFTARSAMR